MKILRKTENFLIIQPDKKKGDPFVDCMKIAEFDWAGEGYKSLIWDTLTERARTFRNMSAMLMKYTTQPMQFGSGPNKMIVPSPGDYGAAQALSINLRAMLQEQPLHTFMLGHIGRETKGKGDDLIVTSAGFALVGQALISSFGSDFDQYLRLFVQSGFVYAQLKSHPVYGSGIRTTKELPKELLVPHELTKMRALWGSFMEMSGIDPADPATGYLRVGMYSEPKVGKSTFVTALPESLLPAVYIADDPGSEYMRTTFPEVLGKTQATPEISGGPGGSPKLVYAQA